VYNAEFHTGTLHDEYGEYAGEVIEDVRDELAASYREHGAFGAMYDFPEPVVSRAGGKVVVAYQDTWFLTYNDDDWADAAKRAVEQLDTTPDNTRDEYTHTIDWLNEWPCIRNYGLGTRLPWDDEFVIEPLSDSTIYMAYYTIAHRLQEIPVEDLDREFFDALFYGEDAVEGSADERALDLRAEWQYWYPVTQRFSANDLISNHLTFFLYHHAELFDEAQWPEGITIMGMGLLEGEKMSSSKGHVVLPGKAIEEYGADTVRFFLLNSAEPWQDYDWRADQVAGVEDQLRRFWNRAQELIDDAAVAADRVDPEDDLNISTAGCCRSSSRRSTRRRPLLTTPKPEPPHRPRSMASRNTQVVPPADGSGSGRCAVDAPACPRNPAPTARAVCPVHDERASRAVDRHARRGRAVARGRRRVGITTNRNRGAADRTPCRRRSGYPHRNRAEP
jgi:Leucyl-tRNA synthetase